MFLFHQLLNLLAFGIQTALQMLDLFLLVCNLQLELVNVRSLRQQVLHCSPKPVDLFRLLQGLQF